MATITEHKNGDGSRSFTAQVRIKPFNPSSKTFHERDYAAGRKEAKRAAEAWAEDLEKTLREQRPGRGTRADVPSLKFRELADEYLADPATKALATYDEREQQIGWFVNRYGAVRALEFPSPVLLREAREALLAQRLRPARVNRYMAAARKCVNFGRAAGLLPGVVWPPALMLKEPKHRDNFLTDEQLSQVLGAARKHSLLMYGAVMFAIGVGCRQSEQLRTRWSDVDEEDGTVAVRVTKSDTRRRAHIPSSVVKALKGLYPANVRPHPTAPVFVHEVPIEWSAWAKQLDIPLGTLRAKAQREELERPTEVVPLKNHELIDRWEKIRKDAGVPNFRWHDLRHSCASILIQNRATLAEVGHQLGHKSVQTTARYAHLIPGAKPTGADKLNEKLGRTK